MSKLLKKRKSIETANEKYEEASIERTLLREDYIDLFARAV